MEKCTIAIQDAPDRACRQFVSGVRWIINAFDDFQRTQEDCMYISGQVRRQIAEFDGLNRNVGFGFEIAVCVSTVLIR